MPYKEHKGSSAYTKQPVNRPYTHPDESNLFLKDPLKYYPSTYM